MNIVQTVYYNCIVDDFLIIHSYFVPCMNITHDSLNYYYYGANLWYGSWVCLGEL
jgi:hypothetical protein